MSLRRRSMAQPHLQRTDRLEEGRLICRAVDKDEVAIRTIIQHHSRRLYRLARSVVRDDGEAEDVLQEAYFRAFTAVAQFRGDSSLATWLSRIVLNEALQRVRPTEQPASQRDLQPPSETNVIHFPSLGKQPVDPERAMAQRQLCKLLESAIDDLPDEFRTVLVARVVEDKSSEETANLLGFLPQTVKTRLHCARELLKDALAEHIDPLFSNTFPFGGKRCEHIADKVVRRLALAH